MKKLETVQVSLEKIVGGGQALGTMSDGQKIFVWGGLPGEVVTVQLTKRKSSYAEGVVSEVIQSSSERIEPRDPESFLSTSPWQIMSFDSEQRHKAALIKEAFELHSLALPSDIEVYTDNREYHYRNKVEFSWYGDDHEGKPTLDLAFFRRGSKGKITVSDSALLPPEITRLALEIRDRLRKLEVSARQLKTLLIRCDAKGNCIWQLYAKDDPVSFGEPLIQTEFSALGGEIIYSNPKSPASVITKRISQIGQTYLSDTILGKSFNYAIEGFFQVNIPVYEQALKDMKEWIDPNMATIDLYSGVGSIGLTIGSPDTILIEINEHAVNEMKRNVKALGSSATPILAPAEKALDYIVSDATIILDPPRAGLHADVTQKLLEQKPPTILYLSCNPVTQARDIALLGDIYSIERYKGYNFFPRTPHIEGLAILKRK